MSKLNVITVAWVNNQEAHIYVDDNSRAWWTRPVPKLGGGEIWELHDDTDEVEGYYETAEDVFKSVSQLHEDLPVVVVRENED